MTAIQASPETIRAVAAALGRARLFDDKIGSADEGRIAAWSEAVDPYAFDVADLLRGVTDYYGGNENGRTMLVGDLIAAAKAVRRDRGESEPADVLDARQAALDARLVNRLGELAESVSLDEPKFKRPVLADARRVACPWPSCRARSGQGCRGFDGRPLTKSLFHDARIQEFEASRVSSIQ